MAASQIELEKEMRLRGRERSQKRNAEAIAKGRTESSSGGQILCRELPILLHAAILTWSEEAKSRPGRRHAALANLQKLDPALVASMTLEILISCVSQRRPMASTAMAIARAVEDEVAFQSFKNAKKWGFEASVARVSDYTADHLKRRNLLKDMVLYGLQTPDWTYEERLALGIVLVELAASSTGVITIQKIREGKREQLILVPAEGLMTWIEDANSKAAALAQQTLPFVEQPLDWIDPVSGGFHSASVRQSALVKLWDKAAVKELLAASPNMPRVYAGVNSLQRTGWRINRDVWEVFSFLWEAGTGTTALPRRMNEDLPIKPSTIGSDPAVRREWKKAARKVHDRNFRHRSERLGVANTYWAAKRYLERQFWFCYQLDWRSRCYALAYYLHPQGGDLPRGLLLFAEGKQVLTPEAKRWHKIHGANCWGMDKKPFEEREAWVDANRETIAQIAKDPLDDRTWEKADSPWQFLAWCLDWDAAQRDPEHVSHLPIHQDASQSGIQIYSLMLRDPEGAKNTNVLPSATPQDLYAKVAARVNDVLVTHLSDDQDTHSYRQAEAWVRFGVDRTFAKRPVMTKVYNATRTSTTRYIAEWALEKAIAHNLSIPGSGSLFGRARFQWMASVLWDAMAEVTRSTEVGQQWLSAVAKVFAKEKKAMLWTTPVGFPVRQQYLKSRMRTVKTSIGKKYRQVTLRLDTAEQDSRRMVQGFAPNYIHSLDASCMLETVATTAEAGVTAFAAIHDSYATLAADSQILADSVREVYIKMFSVDRLRELRDELQTQVEAPLPDVPDYGDLDITKLRESRYFFH